MLSLARLKHQWVYRELLELAIIVLGGTPPRGIEFLALGALHRARWMARIIYAIKI